MHIVYQLVVEYDFQRFVLEINRLLGEGWEAHGSTQVVHRSTKNEYGFEVLYFYYYQGMVLKKDTT